MSFRRAARQAALLILLSLAAVCRSAPGPSEYQVKAVFLFNFGQFVEWPEAAYHAPDSPFAICIVGEDPFGATLDDVVRGESIGPHSLEIRRQPQDGELAGCNILFIGRTEEKRLEQVLEAVRGHHVLTVTDIDGAEKQGAIIVLFNERNRIRMRINLGAARANQLVISSKLLRPAEVIDAGDET